MRRSIAAVMALGACGWAMAAPMDERIEASDDRGVEAPNGTSLPADAYNTRLQDPAHDPCGARACDTPPRLESGRVPTYPYEEWSAGIEGSVSIIFSLDESGRVVDPVVEEASHQAFAQAALEALAGWRFSPALRDGEPVGLGQLRQVFPFQFTDPSPTNHTPAGHWGLDQSQPIEVCRPEGQHRYLSRLVCPNRQHPQARRAGSMGPRVPVAEEALKQNMARWLAATQNYEPLAPGDPEYHHIDRYELDCGDSTVVVYMDMYHCDAPPPDRAPEGFELLY